MPGLADLTRGVQIRPMTQTPKLSAEQVASPDSPDLEGKKADSPSRPGPSPWDVPEWLIDAWRSGQRYAGTKDEELYAKIGELEINMMNHQNPDREEYGLPLSWNWWYYASLLAVAGRRSAMQFLMDNDPNFRAEREAHLARARANWKARRASWRTSE